MKNKIKLLAILCAISAILTACVTQGDKDKDESRQSVDSSSEVQVLPSATATPKPSATPKPTATPTPAPVVPPAQEVPEPPAPEVPAPVVPPAQEVPVPPAPGVPTCDENGPGHAQVGTCPVCDRANGGSIVSPPNGQGIDGAGGDAW